MHTITTTYYIFVIVILCASLLSIKCTRDVALKEQKIKEELKKAAHIDFESFPQ